MLMGGCRGMSGFWNEYGMAKQQSWNIYVKNQQFFSSSSCENHPYSCVVVNVSFSECTAQLSSYTTVLDRYKIMLEYVLPYISHMKHKNYVKSAELFFHEWVICRKFQTLFVIPRENLRKLTLNFNRKKYREQARRSLHMWVHYFCFM